MKHNDRVELARAIDAYEAAPMRKKLTDMIIELTDAAMSLADSLGRCESKEGYEQEVTHIKDTANSVYYTLEEFIGDIHVAEKI